MLPPTPSRRHSSDIHLYINTIILLTLWSLNQVQQHPVHPKQKTWGWEGNRSLIPQTLNQESSTLPEADCLVMKGVRLTETELVRPQCYQLSSLAVSEMWSLHFISIFIHSIACLYLRSTLVKVIFIGCNCIRVNKNKCSLYFTGERVQCTVIVKCIIWFG